MAEHISLDLERVGHCKARRTGGDDALITDLTTRLGVKRRAIEHHHRMAAGLDSRHRDTVDI